MTLKKYVLTMSVATLVCWVGFYFITETVNPEITNWVGFMLFYLSLFLSLAGTASVIGFLVRFLLIRQKLVFRIVAEAFRQSFFLSFLAVACLFLLSQDLFTWLNLGLLVMGLSILEFFLINYKRAS